MAYPFDIKTTKTYRTYKQAELAFEDIAAGRRTMVMVSSESGMRKSYLFKHTLRHHNVPFAEDAPQSDYWLVRTLWRIESGLLTYKGRRPQVLIADDNDSMVGRQSMANILKSALGEDRRAVNFSSAEIMRNEEWRLGDTEAKRKKYNPDIPLPNFRTSIRFGGLSNINYTDPEILDTMSVHFRALISKGLDPVWIDPDVEHDGLNVFLLSYWLATEGGSLRGEGYSYDVARQSVEFCIDNSNKLIDVVPRRWSSIAGVFRNYPPGDDRDRALDRHVRSTDQRPKLILPRSWIPVMLWPSEPPRRNPDPPPDPQPDPDPPKPPAQRPDAAVVSFAKFRRQNEPTPPMADPPPPVSPSESATGPTEPDRADAAPRPPSEPHAEEVAQEPPRTANEALGPIYRRTQIETCESIADALRHDCIERAIKIADPQPSNNITGPSEPAHTDNTPQQSDPPVEMPMPDPDASERRDPEQAIDDMVLDHALPPTDREHAFFGAVSLCRRLTENDQAIVQWIGWLLGNDADLTDVMFNACDTPRQILRAAALLREQRPMLRPVPLDPFRPGPAPEPPVDSLDLLLPPVGERLAANTKDGDLLGFGKGRAKDESELVELKTYAITLLQLHNLQTCVLLAHDRKWWRQFMNDPTLRRMYETAFPPKAKGE